MTSPRRTDRPYRICVVCTGNICRSPVAEVVLRRRLEEAGLGEQVVVDSAGTGDWHVGDGADPRAVASLRRRGYPGEHVARQFDAAWFAERDLVLALDASHLRGLRALAPDRASADEVRLLRSFDPAAGADDLDVPDPYFGDEAGFELVLDQVEAAAGGVVEHVRAQLGR